MTSPRVHRYAARDDVSQEVAQRLVGRLIELQERQGHVALCLTGGRIAHEIYERFALAASTSALDVRRLSLWWTDELFVPTVDWERHSQKALTILARQIALAPRNIHSMPAADGRIDVFEAAEQYADALPDEGFDLTLLGIGADGHVGALYPGHKSCESTLMVVGINDSPTPPAERLTLTLRALNRSRAVWFAAAGREKANAVAESLAPESTLPAGRVHGVTETAWFIDMDAASALDYYSCQL